MTVYFIGAGPGAADLLTLRGAKLISTCQCVYYAGSLVPQAVLEHAGPDAECVDTAPLHLDQIIAKMEAAHAAGHDVARVHSGDPSLYGAIGEQMRRLRALNIPFDICPGVPAYTAAAAKLGKELTLPDISQTVILTRTARKSTDMPDGEDLATLGQSRSTLCIHLSMRNLAQIEKALLPHYGADCPVAVVYKVTWPDERVVRCTLGTLRKTMHRSGITRTALVMVGEVLKDDAEFQDSALYHVDHTHYLRPKTKRPRKATQ
ncbi:MAG: precorrin-4 C(11)-methyltransferase [Pseudomonadota bacterium]